MSNREHRKQSKSESKDYSQQPKPHMGPSGFQIYEYKGHGKDHTVEWIRFQKNLRGAILLHKLDNLVERIIDKGKLPKLPKMSTAEKKAMMATAPKRTMSVADLFGEDDSSADSDDAVEEVLRFATTEATTDEAHEDTILSSAATKSVAKGGLSKKTASAPVTDASKPKSKAKGQTGIKEEVLENPYFETELAVWLDEVKAVNRERVRRQTQLSRDIETFYS